MMTASSLSSSELASTLFVTSLADSLSDDVCSSICSLGWQDARKIANIIVATFFILSPQRKGYKKSPLKTSSFLKEICL